MKKLLLVLSLVGPLQCQTSLFYRRGAVNVNPANGNVYEYQFEDDSTGKFSSNSGNGSIISQGSWVLDNTTSEFGTWSLKQLYVPNGTNNVGTAFYALFSGNQACPGVRCASNTTYKTIYVRFAYKQSNPFNSNGTASNQGNAGNPGIIKFLRFYNTGGSGASYVSAEIEPNSNSPLFTFFADTYAPSGINYTANCNTPAPSPNSFLGQWHWYEIYLDISNDASHVIFKEWIDGVLYHYHDAAFNDNGCGPGATPNSFFVPGNGTNVISQVQFDGTINSMADSSYAWFDQIGISTAQMGVPTSGSNP